ncbi:CGNR zinc finger domain-containing protein [Actinoplanes sp. NPDC089786]|uniref:CGNR zinc finger domain-containing protein n=1 Tax=Actinoplanes sp. NPDC089786 TaxID=3155185 RepID=UPI00342E86AD
MIFAHDTEISLAGAAALVNTTDGGEQLPDLAALDAFYRTWQWTGRRAGTEAELRAVHKLRPRLRQVWEAAGEEQIVVLVNELLREGRALPQLVRHDQFSWHLHAAPSEAPLATRMMVEAAMAFVDMIREDELSRLRRCAADDCDNVLVDLSKNRSKRFCEAGCGNRAAVNAYRARKAGRVRP